MLLLLLDCSYEHCIIPFVNNSIIFQQGGKYMLEILYVASAVASFYTMLFKHIGQAKKCFLASIIAIVSGILYSIPMVIEICNNVFAPNFWNIFGLLSLLFWDISFLTNNSSNCISYMLSAFFASIVLYFLGSNFIFPDYLINCAKNHNYTEQIAIISTVDGSKFGQSIYGNGFVVGSFDSKLHRTTFYQYYFQTEDGNIDCNNISAKYTTINYVDDGVEPFVEITYDVKCSGFRNKSGTHVFSKISPTYNLNIPKNSIQTNINPAS